MRGTYYFTTWAVLEIFESLMIHFRCISDFPKVWWYIQNNCLSDLQTAKYGTRQNLVCARTAWLLQIWFGADLVQCKKWCIVAMTMQHGCWQRRAKSKDICSWSSAEPPTGKNTQFHQELQRNDCVKKFQHPCLHQWFTYHLYTCYVTVLYAA